VALLLENTHLTVPGAMRHPSTLPPGSHVEVVPGAFASLVVGAAYGSVAPRYVESARHVDDGVSLITANCGFAIAYQSEVAAAVTAPVALSSLLLVPLLARVYRHRVGVLTYDADQLDEARRRAAGWPGGFKPPILGMRDRAEWANLAEIATESIDATRLGDELISAMRPFCTDYELLAVLLECTAMIPFRARMREELGVAVFDMVGLVDFLLNRPVLGAFDAPTDSTGP